MHESIFGVHLDFPGYTKEFRARHPGCRVSLWLAPNPFFGQILFRYSMSQYHDEMFKLEFIFALVGTDTICFQQHLWYVLTTPSKRKWCTLKGRSGAILFTCKYFSWNDKITESLFSYSLSQSPTIDEDLNKLWVRFPCEVPRRDHRRPGLCQVAQCKLDKSSSTKNTTHTAHRPP